MISGSKILSNILTARAASKKNATEASSPHSSQAFATANTAVLVMAESAGLFSTRLGSLQHATAVASAMLRRVLSVATRSNVGDVHLAWRGLHAPDLHPTAAGRSHQARLYGSVLANGGRWHFQQGHDFAQRLHTSVSRLFAQGYSQVIVVSSDTPGISTSLLRQAHAKLGASPLVIGPDTRGGCYLLALTPETLPLLARIQWQQNRDAAQIASLRPDAQLLQTVLTDIDQSAHVRTALPESSAAWLGRLLQRLNHTITVPVLRIEQAIILKFIECCRLYCQLPPPRAAAR